MEPRDSARRWEGVKTRGDLKGGGAYTHSLRKKVLSISDVVVIIAHLIL